MLWPLLVPIGLSGSSYYFKTITDLGFPSADLHNDLREDTATSCYTHEAFIAIVTVIFSLQIDASVNGTLR